MSANAMPQYLNTTQVARALGLSVSTVKRWVDDGVLPAHKTAGGHRKLLMSDVMDLVRAGELPHTDLTQLLALGRRDKKPEPATLAEPITQALLHGDTVQARTLIHGNYRRGIAIEDLADLAVGPAMHRIGQEWAAGRIEIMEEHRAAELCAGILYELKADIEKRAGKNRPCAIGGAIEQDFSVLPTLLAQLVLLDAGWDAINLGPNTPFSSFARAITQTRPKLVWISCSHLVEESEFVTGYRKLYRQAEKAGVAVAIGGRALGESVRSQIPYTTYGDGLRQLAAFARSLHPRTALPRRGRPKYG